jgi:hypothetical protein
MSDPMYIVETTDDFSDAVLAIKCCDLYARGYFVLQVIEPAQPDADTGYKVIAYKRKP